MLTPQRFIVRSVVLASAAVSVALSVAFAATAFAQDAQAPSAPPAEPASHPATPAHEAHGEDVGALAKATQNPVADLVSLPFQFNFNMGGALGDQTMFNLNFQPVIPIHLGSKVNLIARSIVPMLSTPTPTGDRDRGIGDIQEQLFFAPSAATKVVWGVGPALSFPTATVPVAITGSWGLGPSGVVVATLGPFVVGALASQVWSVKDNEGRPRTNLLSVQPFFNYNFGHGWALGLAPIITASWDAARDDTWTLPLGASISRTLVFAKQPMTLGFQYYYNVLRPDSAAANQIRVVVNFLFPGKA
jgi:hypothetical protein